MRPSRFFAPCGPLAAVVAAAALLSACGDDPASPADSAVDATPSDTDAEDGSAGDAPSDADPAADSVGPDPDAGRCVPDPTLLAARRACTGDDQCPCGAHCALGVCAATCGDGLTACAAGLTCDPFGRCRDPLDAALTPSAVPTSPGTLRLDDAVRVPAGGEGLLRLRALGGAVGTVRVVAPAGYDVRCASGAPLAPECELAAVPAGGEVAVTLRARAATPQGRDRAAGPLSDGAVRVYWGDQLETRSLVPVPPAAPAPALPLAELRAVWQGSAVRVGAALGADPLDPVGGLALPIAAQLYDTSPTTGVLVLIDRYQVFGDSPDATWPLALAYAPATGAATLALTRRAITAGNLTPGTPVEVLLDPAPTATVAWGPEGRSLTFEIDATYLGITTAAAPLRARWRIVLERAGALATDLAPPPLPTPPAPTLTADAATTRTAWDHELQRAMTPWSTVTDLSTLKALVRTAAEPADPARRLDACGPDAALTPSTRDALVVSAFEPPIHDALKAQILAASPLYGVDVTAVHMNPMPGLPPALLPCAATLNLGSGSSDCGSGIIAHSASIDLCDAFAAAYGCQIIALDAYSSEQLEVYLSGPVKLRPPASPWCDAPSDAEVWGPATRACVVPPIRHCGELVACADAVSGTTTALGRDLATSVLPTSGDLRCADGGPLAAAPRADVRRDSAQPPRRGELVDACAADLRRLAQPAPTTGGVAALFDPDATCIDAARHLIALELATEASRRRLADPALPADPRGDRFAQRLIAQWLEIHAHLALEARERVLPAVITDGAGGGLALTAAEALERSLDGWRLLLHPRFALALLGADPAALADPDYRVRWIPTLATPSADPQQDGLPIALFATLRAQLDLAERVLEARPSGLADLRRVGLVLRLAAPVEALAVALHDRATLALGAGETLAWQDRYDDARAQWAAALARFSGVASDLSAGRDRDLPTDADLPLYFRSTGSEPASRFAAISDYLLGTTPGSPAWATATVAAAATALTDARAAYLEQLDQTYKADIDVEARETYYRDRYGLIVANFCGVPAGLSTDEVLDGWEAVRGQPFDPATCAIALEDPSCRSDFEIANGLLDRDDALLALCTVAQTNARLAGAASFRDPALTALAVAANLDACGELAPCADGAGVCLSCGSLTAVVDGARLAGRQLAEWVPADLVDAAEVQCRALYPNAHARIPLPVGAADNPLGDGRCYRGAGGELALAIQAAALEVETARSELNDARESYQIALQSCIALTEGADAVAAANAAYVVIAGVLEAGIVVANTAANAAGAVADCTYAMSGVDGIAAVGTAGANLVVAGVGCGFSGVQVAAQAVSDALQGTLNETERIHETIVRAIDDETAVKVCVNDAAQHLVGMRTAQLQIERALHEVDTASYKLRDASAAAGRAYREGRAALAELAVTGSRVPRPAVWLDRRIDRFRDTMRLARRVTYLAVRALEWEFQVSLPDRFEVARAETPDVLAAVLDRLRTTAAPSGIGGSAPAELKVVLSLRDHVLQLEDRTGYPADEHNLSAVERLRMMLASPKHAVFDDDGSYLGQALPFALAPLGALGVGDPRGVPILAATDCAERVWSVNASILGAGPLYRGSETTFVRVDLLKQNTFYSQWCGDRPAADGPFQVASVRPAINLFRDPLIGGTIESPAGSSPGNERFSRARIEAYLNVPRATFEGDAYQAGATTELAARGLYGQYALFIPKDLIARRRSDGTMSPGLDLWQIDDVLLRLDYVSVAKP